MSNEIEKALFVELRSTGVSLSKISEQINISKPTLIKWSYELKEDIENASSLEIQRLREVFKATKFDNLKKLFEIRAKVLVEVDFIYLL